jgi:hypothetical protein
MRREVEGLLKNASGRTLDAGTVREDDINALPEPVQRYLIYTQIVGKPRIRTVSLKQRGYFRQKQNQKWLPLRAVQYFTLDPPGFVWYGSLSPAPLVSITGTDVFCNGKGRMVIKLLSLFRIADASGPEVDQGELLRYLGEMVWFPTACLNDFIRWHSVDSRSARATITTGGITASGVFHFNDRGEIVDLVAERYGDFGRGFELATWSPRVSEYREINGLRIPMRGEVAWKLKSGEFPYGRMEITEIEYDSL